MVRKSKCSSQLCRSCKCTSSISRWAAKKVGFNSQDIQIRVLVLSIATKILLASLVMIALESWWFQMSSPVEFMEIQPQPSRDVLQETLQEEEVQFKILKITIQFSKRTRVALLKSLDNTSQNKLRQVHIDSMKDLWETSQKLWPRFQPLVSLALQLLGEVKLLIFLRWSRASQNTATKNLVLKWAKLLAMEKSH